MRKLASIQKVINVENIQNADLIEKITVLGWNIVVKKNEFKKGDLVVYVEIDSLLPEIDDFEFLRKSNFIIRTIKLKGQVSQGICFPLSILENFISKDKIKQLKEGDEVTDIIGIKKYEAPIPLSMSGKAKGVFPTCIPKTDETRIQSIPDLLEKYKGTECFVTEKLDGSSMTVYLKDGEYGVCTRNLDMYKDASNIFWVTSEKEDLENKLRKLAKLLNVENISVQGELIGSGVQGNKYKLNGTFFFAFNLFDIDKYKYIDFNELYGLCKSLEIKTVPILNEKFVLNNTVEELVEMSKGYSLLNSHTKREGIVIRSLKERSDIDEIGRFSFKVINPEFLLKYNE